MLFHMGIASEEAGKYTICVESEKTAKLENEHVLLVYRQHPQMK